MAEIGTSVVADRCACWHIIAKHGEHGCRYCDCQRHQPVPIAESFAHVIGWLGAEGDSETAESLRSYAMRRAAIRA